MIWVFVSPMCALSLTNTKEKGEKKQGKHITQNGTELLMYPYIILTFSALPEVFELGM